MQPYSDGINTAVVQAPPPCKPLLSVSMCVTYVCVWQFDDRCTLHPFGLLTRQACYTVVVSVFMEL